MKRILAKKKRGTGYFCPLFLFLVLFPPFTDANPSLKVVDGRVKEIRSQTDELVLAHRNPVNRQDEELTFAVDEATGFEEGVHFEDLKQNEPISVDYVEGPDAVLRAIQVKRVDLTGVPIDKNKKGEDAAAIHFFHALKVKQEGNLLAAERLFRKAIDIEPQNADFHFELGNLYAEQNEPEWARSEYEQAVMINPRHLAANYNLGLVYIELELFSEAREQFRKVLTLDPQNVKAQIQIGYSYADEGFYEDAREAFETAIDMDPMITEPRDALNELKRIEEAAIARSRSDLNRSMLRNERSLQFLARDSQQQSKTQN